MPTYALMLRGINLGPKRRVAMGELRSAFADAGFGDVRTYVQSGNVVLGADAGRAELERASERLIADRFGFDVPVVARSGDDLARVVSGNPLADVADDPKRYQVSFLSDELGETAVARLRELVAPGEALAFGEREVYAWHPRGIARSKLSLALGGKGLEVTATSRNWTTVTTLLEMARG
jgi:uncharacterized protein (DUF1697 family)